MKRNHRNQKIIFLILILIYCLSINLVQNDFYNSTSPLKDLSTSEKDNYSSTISADTFDHPLIAERTLNSSSSTPISNPKNHLKKISGVAKLKELISFNICTQYLSYSVNFLIRFRKSDIIFPFHYFW